MDWNPHVFRHQIEPALRDWLTHRGSLTARLRDAFPSLRVRVLRQQMLRAHADEARLLGLRADELAWVREVVLCAGEMPLVFAHSVLPRANVRGAWNLFAGLGARPLGEVLFTDPGISRGALHYRKLDSRHPLNLAASRALGRALPALWARRSLFVRKQRGLLVTEVFLPDLLK